MNSRDAEADSVPDEHQRYARHRHALATVDDAHEANLVATVLGDPDSAMARSAVVTHIDNRARQLLVEEGYSHWSAEMAAVIGKDEFLSRRLREWTLLRSITIDERWTADDITTASDWFQRLAAATTTSTEVLRLLAEQGRTRRVRAAARQQSRPANSVARSRKRR